LSVFSQASHVNGIRKGIPLELYSLAGEKFRIRRLVPELMSEGVKNALIATKTVKSGLYVFLFI